MKFIDEFAVLLRLHIKERGNPRVIEPKYDPEYLLKLVKVVQAADARVEFGLQHASEDEHKANLVLIQALKDAGLT